MWRPFLWSAIAAFGLDQVSKVVIVHLLGLRRLGDIDVWPPYLTLRMAWNRGVNFGLFPAGSDLGRWVLITLSLAICAALVWWLRRERPRPIAMAFGGILFGGALGNVLDRLLYGAVADFLNMSCCGIDNPYAFNIADVAIFVGAIGLIVFADGEKRR